MVIGGHLRPDCEEQYKGVYFGSVPLNVVQELRKLWKGIKPVSMQSRELTARNESGISMLM